MRREPLVKRLNLYKKEWTYAHLKKVLASSGVVVGHLEIMEEMPYTASNAPLSLFRHANVLSLPL